MPEAQPKSVILRGKKIAVVCARGLGDGLLSMTLSHNLLLSGYDVTTYSSILCQLRSWFPDHQISSYPDLPRLQETFAPYDVILAADHSILSERPHLFDGRLQILKEAYFDKKKTMVENLIAFCEKKLELAKVEKTNGIRPPSRLQWRRYPKRIILHPMSNDVKKNWPEEKYWKLAQRLAANDWLCALCMNSEERKTWKHSSNIPPAIHMPEFATVDLLAAYVYESGFMIGNDSGIGHLASILQIPTVSLFARKSYSALWRPGWHNGIVVTPLPLLLGSRLKERYWKKFLAVFQVQKAFDKFSNHTQKKMGGKC